MFVFVFVGGVGIEESVEGVSSPSDSQWQRQRHSISGVYHQHQETIKSGAEDTILIFVRFALGLNMALNSIGADP